MLIDDPLLSPGVVLGNATNPMAGVTFDDVVVRTPSNATLRGRWPFGTNFQCEHAHVSSVGGTTPRPVCSASSSA